MTFIPTQSGFMCLEDSDKLLRAIFRIQVEPRYPAPQLEPIPQDIDEERSLSASLFCSYKFAKQCKCKEYREETMGATVAFTDLGSLAGAGFPNISDLEDQQLHLETEISSEHCFEDIVGKSPAIQRVLEQVAIVAPTDSTVLLHGETGTGKELIARAIHKLSSRRDRPYVRMNCAAIPSGLLESELFGHEKGAFTGALMQRKGRFELADGGSLFLDEIGDISLELQPKLLRAIQEQEFERLGSSRTIR